MRMLEHGFQLAFTRDGDQSDQRVKTFSESFGGPIRGLEEIVKNKHRIIVRFASRSLVSHC